MKFFIFPMFIRRISLKSKITVLGGVDWEFENVLLNCIFCLFHIAVIGNRAGSGPGRPAGRAGPGRAGPIFEEKHPGRAGPGRLFGIQLIIS